MVYNMLRRSESFVDSFSEHAATYTVNSIFNGVVTGIKIGLITFGAACAAKYVGADINPADISYDLGEFGFYYGAFRGAFDTYQTYRGDTR